MRVIIAGGRFFDDRVALRRAIADAGFAITEVVCGGARGADTLGAQWAAEFGLPVALFSADWKRYGNAAGHIRNRQMAVYADALIAMPGGRGTQNMIEQARAAGLAIFIA